VNDGWLVRALEASRALGFLGPASLEAQVLHAEGFARCWESRHSAPPTNLLDLGTGGGLPGLVLLDRWHVPTVLLDSMERRCRFLQDVFAGPGAPSEVEIVHARAEDAARDPSFEGRFALVTARSFGSPSVTAECAARFMIVGGVLVVSEPPQERSARRWQAERLSELGLSDEGRQQFEAGYEVLTKVGVTDPRYPRASGTPKKRPLF